jgi:hypothetical protein
MNEYPLHRRTTRLWAGRDCPLPQAEWTDGDLAWSGNRIGQVNDLEHSRVAELSGLNSLHEVLSSMHLTHLMMR